MAAFGTKRRRPARRIYVSFWESSGSAWTDGLGRLRRESPTRDMRASELLLRKMSIFRGWQFPDLIDEIYKPRLKRSQHAALVPELYLARSCAHAGIAGRAQAQGSRCSYFLRAGSMRAGPPCADLIINFNKKHNRAFAGPRCYRGGNTHARRGLGQGGGRVCEPPIGLQT
jgi:hypothetical protein